MAITPYQKLGSQDILSAHLNGLQYGINNLESVLNMKTATKMGAVLTPVTDMDDTTLRYRIYEADDRNWLLTPAPVIKRNGQVVNTSEYSIQPAYGVVIFHIQQNSSDVITADFTYVKAQSARLDAIEQDTAQISALNQRLTTVEGNITTLQGTTSALNTRVSTLEASGGSTIVKAPLDPNLLWLENAKSGKRLSTDQNTATNVLMGAQTIDAFPFFVEYTVEIDAIRTVTSLTNTVSTQIIAGIYSNKNVAPDTLLSSTAPYDATAPGEKIVNLQNTVKLDPGLYWLARYHSAGVRLDGYTSKNTDGTTNIIQITRPSSSSVINESGTNGIIIGVRSASVGSLTTLPTTFPAISSTGTKYLARDAFGLIQARVKRAF